MVGAEYCDKLVCLSVCMSLSHTHISETACPNFNKPFIGFWLPRKARLNFANFLRLLSSLAMLRYVMYFRFSG